MMKDKLNLPLTITRISDDAEKPQALTPSYYKQPDLTFHCNVCAAFFVNPFELFQHMNAHPILDDPEIENITASNSFHSNNIGNEFDYSCVLEPVCDIVALAEKKRTLVKTTIEDGIKQESDSEDTDSDEDDDDSSTSSSSNSSSSSESVHSNKKIKVEPIAQNVKLEYDSAQYGEMQDRILKFGSSLNTEYMGNINESSNRIIQPIKRRRGRRSNAQYVPALGKQQKFFQCVQCDASFPNAGDLSKHVRSHITNKPFQCSICKKTFTHIGSLNTHLRIHSGEKPYKCEMCSKAFTQSSSLMVHLRSHHHSVPKPHQCHLCDKGFVNSSSLVLHLKTHSEVETFVCPECDKVFKQEEQLDEHMRTHTQELLFQCSICQNAFRTSSELVQHMKVHMGEKPFSCSICDARFTQSGSLNIHMRIHTGEKPFHCNVCNKSFTQASSLSVHMKIHNPGEKPFPCHICGKAYSQQAYLNKHIQSHTQPKTETENLMCIVCGSLHIDVESLSRHVTQMHAALLSDFKDARNQTLPQSNETEMRRLQMLLQKQHRSNEMATRNVTENEQEIDQAMYGVVEEEDEDEESNAVEYDFEYAAEEEVETVD